MWGGFRAFFWLFTSVIYAGANIIGEFSPQKTYEGQLPNLGDRIQGLIFWYILRIKSLYWSERFLMSRLKYVRVSGFICSVFGLRVYLFSVLSWFGVDLKFVVFVKSATINKISHQLHRFRQVITWIKMDKKTENYWLC